MTTMAFTTRSNIIERYHPKKCIYHTTRRNHQRNEIIDKTIRHRHDMNMDRNNRPSAMKIVEASSSLNMFNSKEELQFKDGSSTILSVPSTPCVRICRYNSNFYNGQVCIGCYREVYEIGTWQGMTNNKKSLTLLDCIERCNTQQHESGGFDGAITIEELTQQYMYWSDNDFDNDDYNKIIINNNDNMESSNTDDDDGRDIGLLDQIVMHENQHEGDDESTVQQRQEFRTNQEVSPVVHQHQQTQIVAKTVESFKLADLYWLESCVISHYVRTNTNSTTNTNHHQQQKVDSLAFHHPTASHLLSCWTSTADDASNYDTTTTHREDRRYMTLPFRNKRIQYIAEILASGYTPLQLIDNISSSSMTLRKGINSSLWTLEYDVFERWYNNDDNNNDDNDDNNNYQNQQDKVCSTMLLCAVSRALPGEPSLSSSSSLLQDNKVGSITPYIIIETSSQLYLAQKLSVRQSTIPTQDKVNFDLAQQQQQQQQQYISITDQFQSLWSKRPFQYSGAINIGVASIIIDMLSDALQLRQEQHQQLHTRVSSMDSIDNTNNNMMSTSKKQRITRILDPTCGSGTFLALALMIWCGKYTTATATATDSSNDTVIVEATGIDSNYKCARGTMANLRHIFGLSTSDDDDGDDDDDDVIRKWTLNLSPATGRLTSTSSSALPLSQVTIHANDSVNLSTFILDKFDCAVANLPWNRNTFEYQGQTTNNDTTTNTSTSCCTNERILLSTAAVLKPGAPLVVISDGRNSNSNTRQDTKSKYTSFNVNECLEGMGFVILGQATIPPRGFQLPASGNKKKIKTKKDVSIVAAKNENVQRNSDCLITVAIAPG
jgi:predicted Fe-S protein YdhL (DUF1289 family)